MKARNPSRAVAAPGDMHEHEKPSIALTPGDALIIVDVQNDFLPGGKVPVPGGDAVIPLLNRYVEQFLASNLPIFATRYCHPPNHCSFLEQGGIWPSHCVAFSSGAEFSESLQLPVGATVIARGGETDKETCSAFDGTDLAERLCGAFVGRLFVGGLATEYSVLRSVRDAVAFGYSAVVLEDAVRAFNRYPDDGDRALDTLRALGASLRRYEEFQCATWQ